MNKFWIITSHTYVTKLKSKAFYISTILILFFLMLMLNFDSIIESFVGDDEKKVAIIDESDILLEYITVQPNEEVNMEPFTESVEEAKSLVLEGDYDALLLLNLDSNGFPEATFFAENITDSSLQTTIQQQLQQAKVALTTSKLGVDQSEIANMFIPVEWTTVALDTNSKSQEELDQARGIVYLILLFLYVSVIMYGSIIATDVATEKSSRVMELLISSVSPIVHMFAKIIGIALVGLTQIALFILVSFIMLQVNKDRVGGILESFGLQDASISIILYGILFFLLGYFLYATLAAMLGSLVTRVEEANQIITPLIMLLALAFFLAIFGMNTPDSQLVTITSYIPFFSPMLMFIRVGLLDIAAWEVLLSVGVLLVTILLLAIIGAKVYKGGVLMYGKSNAFKDIKKALQLTKKE
ncbi:hypothetical protein GCM10008025_16350 [Ornithinibacillus halotolerans]|uniref:ABC-2 type transporter transmembrane domain-containing protein n=1 Tax=Ornithinibacillus halotolerans TaxID=1274357 RepID=A0A916W7S7_9BACI|nr:hypothetical protein GCM10008025_16350 [Ornithinibacillus halotolerans]